jgi:biopolymer transport protein TolQ
MLPTTPDDTTVQLDLLALLIHASWPVKITLAVLVVASTLVWLIGVLKMLQVARLRAAERGFDGRARQAASPDELVLVAREAFASPGARVVAALHERGPGASAARLRAAADQAIVRERQRARVFMSLLASIASASPFVGLFGTVYGIMDAFVRIGAAKSASLPVVAPAIGEALITTAIGLAAAIPAVLFYNSIDRQIGDFVAELEASAAEWVVVLAGDGAPVTADAPVELRHESRARSQRPSLPLPRMR